MRPTTATACDMDKPATSLKSPVVSAGSDDMLSGKDEGTGCLEKEANHRKGEDGYLSRWIKVWETLH